MSLKLHVTILYILIDIYHCSDGVLLLYYNKHEFLAPK